MSLKKNQKAYNKQVMRTGEQANRYLNNALGLINTYTTDYAGRNEFWLNKLNNRQLDLLSNKYLAENANMLRGSAAFGSNSQLNRQINENAYSQQNYLANVQNQNVMNANQLQENELRSLMNAASTYNTPIAQGMSAAANVDAANNAWMAPVGGAMQVAGTLLAPFTGGASLGLTALGAGLSNIGSQAYQPGVWSEQGAQQFGNAAASFQNAMQQRKNNLSTIGNQSSSTLSSSIPK